MRFRSSTVQSEHKKDMLFGFSGRKRNFFTEVGGKARLPTSHGQPKYRATVFECVSRKPMSTDTLPTSLAQTISFWMGSPGDFPGRQLQLRRLHSSQKSWQQDINTITVALMPQFHFWDPQIVLVEVSFPPRKASPRAELSAVDHLTSLQFPGGPLFTSPVS